MSSIDPLLPNELASLVDQHKAALTLQRFVRNSVYSITIETEEYHNKWPSTHLGAHFKYPRHCQHGTGMNSFRVPASASTARSLYYRCKPLHLVLKQMMTMTLLAKRDFNDRKRMYPKRKNVRMSVRLMLRFKKLGQAVPVFTITHHTKF